MHFFMSHAVSVALACSGVESWYSGDEIADYSCTLQVTKNYSENFKVSV